MKSARFLKRIGHHLEGTFFLYQVHPPFQDYHYLALLEVRDPKSKAVISVRAYPSNILGKIRKVLELESDARVKSSRDFLRLKGYEVES